MSEEVNSIPDSVVKGLNQYIQKIQLTKVELNEKWKCRLCGSEFYYRPYFCDVVCNECNVKRINQSNWDTSIQGDKKYV